MDFIPEKSEIQVSNILTQNDRVLKQMIKDLGVKKLIPGLKNQDRPRRNRGD